MSKFMALYESKKQALVKEELTDYKYRISFGSDEDAIDAFMAKYNNVISVAQYRGPGTQDFNLKDESVVPEMKETYGDALKIKESPILERAKIKGQPGSVTTQVATTAASVGKAAKAAASNVADGTEIKRALEYGAGKGVGIPKLQEVLGADVEVKSYEPHPVGWSPDYTDNTSISGKYEVITCTNVINVVPKDIRDAIIKDIASLLSDGGVAAVSSRGWKGDINLAKNFKEYDKEDKAILILKKNKETKELDEVFQKGFDGNELVEYATTLLGSKYEVTKNNSFGNKGIIIKKA